MDTSKHTVTIPIEHYNELTAFFPKSGAEMLASDFIGRAVAMATDRNEIFKASTTIKYEDAVNLGEDDSSFIEFEIIVQRLSDADPNP